MNNVESNFLLKSEQENIFEFKKDCNIENDESNVDDKGKEKDSKEEEVKFLKKDSRTERCFSNTSLNASDEEFPTPVFPGGSKQLLQFLQIKETYTQEDFIQDVFNSQLNLQLYQQYFKAVQTINHSQMNEIIKPCKDDLTFHKSSSDTASKAPKLKTLVFEIRTLMYISQTPEQHDVEVQIASTSKVEAYSVTFTLYSICK
jgi:hypothetical protein